MENNMREKIQALVFAAFDYADEVCEQTPTCQKCYANGKNCRQRIVADRLVESLLTISAEGEKQDNWISAKHPPQKDGKYLVCGPTLPSVVKNFAANPRFFAEENVWYEYNRTTRTYHSINNSVTHWMPIPEKASLDDFVEFWTQNETGKSLREFLGMTREAYEEWLKRGEVSEQ